MGCGPQEDKNKGKGACGTNTHEAGKVEVAVMAVDLADAQPMNQERCCRELKDEMVATETKQDKVVKNSRVEESMIGT